MALAEVKPARQLYTSFAFALPLPLPLSPPSHNPRYSLPPNLVVRHEKIPIPARALLFEIGRIDERFQPGDDVLFLEMCVRGVEVGYCLFSTGGVSWGGRAVEYGKSGYRGYAGGDEFDLVRD